MYSLRTYVTTVAFNYWKRIMNFIEREFHRCWRDGVYLVVTHNVFSGWFLSNCSFAFCSSEVLLSVQVKFWFLFKFIFGFYSSQVFLFVQIKFPTKSSLSFCPSLVLAFIQFKFCFLSKLSFGSWPSLVLVSVQVKCYFYPTEVLQLFCNLASKGKATVNLLLILFVLNFPVQSRWKKVTTSLRSFLVLAVNCSCKTGCQCPIP